MIGKITGGASFGGALEYLTQPKEKGRAQEEQEHLKETAPQLGEQAPPYGAGERHRVIGGNMSGQTAEELRQEFEAVRRQRPDIGKPVHHASLSAGERDRITVEEWREIAARYVERMGYKDAPYVVVQHRDGVRDHIHILTSRVDVNGKVVSDWRCKQRAEDVLREIEREHGLELVKSSREVKRAAPSRGELERFNRTGELSAKMSMQAHVELALKDAPTATEFIERLQLRGIETIPYVQKSGKATGVSFRKGEELMKGSDLGRGFSWNALQERGLDYQPERDRPAIEAARERAMPGREAIISAPGPERDFAGLPREAGREIGDYMLDQANAARQFESQARMFEQAGRGSTDGVTALQALVTERSDVAQTYNAAGLEMDGRDAVERLQRAAGVEPAHGDHDALEKLGRVTGLERKDPGDLTRTLKQPLQPALELTPALEPAAEEQILAPIIELTL